MDKYFIIWEGPYDQIEVITCDSQGECEKELDTLILDNAEIRHVIVGEELTWEVHINTELKEKK